MESTGVVQNRGCLGGFNETFVDLFVRSAYNSPLLASCMRKTECSKSSDDLQDVSYRRISAIGGRARVLLLLTVLGSTACGKTMAHEHPDAGPPEGVPLVSPAAYGEFGKGTYRAQFAAEFAKNLELSRGADGFFIAPDYQWQLEEAIKRTVPGKEVPDDVLRQMNNAVLAQMLQKVHADWARNALPEKEGQMYRSTYTQNLHRCYTNLRYLEVLPDQPMKKGNGDKKKLIEVWSERDQKAWELTQESPFFGPKKDPASAGPLEKPLMPLVQKLITEITEPFPYSSSNDFKTLYLSKVQFAVLDMVLPGINLEAIRDRQRRAGLLGNETGFSEQNFENELKKAFAQRSKFFGQNGAQNVYDATEHKIFEVIGAKFEEFGKMEHPLELYKHN